SLAASSHVRRRVARGVGDTDHDRRTSAAGDRLHGLCSDCPTLRGARLAPHLWPRLPGLDRIGRAGTLECAGGSARCPRYFLRPELVRAGTFWPLRRASDKPIAIACLRLLTVLRLRPLFKVPRLRRLMALFTVLSAFLE